MAIQIFLERTFCLVKEKILNLQILALSADKQARHYYIEWKNHHSSQWPQGTGIKPLQDKMQSHIYANLARNAIARLTHPWSGCRGIQWI